MSEKKTDAWMPLWIGAYLADTMTLTTQQHGAYLLLLFAYWRNQGPLQDDDEDLGSITKASPAEWRKLRQKLARFFDVADGVWKHGRADKELVKAGEHQASATSRAQAGGKALAEKRRKQCLESASSTASSTLEACSTPTPSSLRSETEDYGAKAPASSAHAVTPAAAVCIALKAAGIGSVSPGNMRLLMLLDAGATVAEFAGAAPKALDAAPARAFEYVLATVEGERKRAKETAGLLHRGPLRVVNKQEALEAENRRVGEEWLRQTQGATS